MAHKDRRKPCGICARDVAHTLDGRPYTHKCQTTDSAGFSDPAALRSFPAPVSDPAPTVEAPDAEESSMSETVPGFVAGPPAPAEVSHWQQQAREAAARHVGMMDAAGATVIGPVPVVATSHGYAYGKTMTPMQLAAPDAFTDPTAVTGPHAHSMATPMTPDAFMDPAAPEETPAVNVSGQPDPRYEWWGEQNRGYLVKLPETGDFRRYKNGRPKGITRATTFNKAASDTTSLTDWKLRNVIIGASKRPDLLLQAHDLTHKDSAKLNKLAAELEAVAGAKVGADIGTFLHEFCEHIDAGLKTWRDAPAQYQAQLRLYSETLAEAGFETVPGMIERTTYIAEFGGVVGRFDRILFHRPSDMYVIADLKTGRTMDYARLENECQEWIYAHGVNKHGVYDWNTDTWEEPHTLVNLYERLTVSETVGLIIHMPVQGDDAGQVILEKTDLQRGKRYAATCAENRGWVKPKRELWSWEPEAAAEKPWHDIGGGLEVKHSIVLPAPEPAPQFKRSDWRTRFRAVTSREEANALYKQAKAEGVPVPVLGDLVVIGKDALASLAEQDDVQ